MNHKGHEGTARAETKSAADLRSAASRTQTPKTLKHRGKENAEAHREEQQKMEKQRAKAKSKPEEKQEAKKFFAVWHESDY